MNIYIYDYKYIYLFIYIYEYKLYIYTCMHINWFMIFMRLIITPSYEAGVSPSPDNSHPGATLKKEIQWKNRVFSMVKWQFH